MASCKFTELKISCKTTRSHRHPESSRSWKHPANNNKEPPASCNFKELKASCSKTTRDQRHPESSRSWKHLAKQQGATGILQLQGAESILQNNKEPTASYNYKALKASCKTTRSQRHPATSRSWKHPAAKQQGASGILQLQVVFFSCYLFGCFQHVCSSLLAYIHSGLDGCLSFWIELSFTMLRGCLHPETDLIGCHRVSFVSCLFWRWKNPSCLGLAAKS